MNIDQTFDRSGDINWSELNEKLQGRVVLRGSMTYEDDRRNRLWNARKPDRFPDAIAQAISTADVREAVRFARQYRLRVSVRGGGHHFNGPSLVQGGLLIDLQALKKISVDPKTMTTTVQPGVTAGELMAALTPHGLAFPVGHCRTVPLGGFLLAGGFGWNGGHWGPACLSVTKIEMVDANGETVTADAGGNPDLYWAARGGAMGFPGIVTCFHLKVYALPRAIRTSALTFVATDMQAAAEWVADVHPSLPPQVELIGLVVSPPPEAQAGGAPSRVFIVSATAFADTEADAAAWLTAFNRGPTHPAPINRSVLADTPFDTLFAGMDQAFPEHHRYAADHVWSNSAPDKLLADVKAPVLSPPSARDFLLLAFAPPPSSSAPPLSDMALTAPAGIYVGIYAVWDDSAQDASNIAWVHSMSAALERHLEGRYIGETDLDAGPGRTAQCYSATAWDRLARLRNKYDPDSIFFSFPEPDAVNFRDASII